MANAVMTAGWVAVAVPQVLGHRLTQHDTVVPAVVSHTRRRMRRKLIERFEDMIAHDAKAIILLGESMSEEALRREEAVRQELGLLREQLVRSPEISRLSAQAVAVEVFRTVKRKLLHHAPPRVLSLLGRIRGSLGI